MKKIFFVSVFFLILFPAFARDITITVEDIDLGLPLEGATITSWDGRQYTSDREGKVLVSVPDERQVLIHASYPGYESARLVVTGEGTSYTLGLRLSGILENKELVIEASKPGKSETRTGRSVALSERDIAQTGEIGIIEDVMRSVKLLPGVGYAGSFNAMPSIRGGEPGDLTASLDGYYVFNPYHWGGGFSIFDPRMVQSAQLSHGVFSSRFGHTISGLLEITSRKPSSTETEFEFSVNTSAANINVSLPVNGKGGIIFMGRVTYYDPIVGLIKQLSKVIEPLDPVNSIRVAPYIRSTTITGNYRFSDSLEFQGTGFWGMDGIGVSFENFSEGELISSNRMIFDWTNYQGFMTASLLWNPRNDMLLKVSGGAGYEDAVINGDIEQNIIRKTYSSGFTSTYPWLTFIIGPDYSFNTTVNIYESDFLFNAQGRVDYDWELGNGFVLALGVQELYNRLRASGDMGMLTDVWYNDLTDTSSLPPSINSLLQVFKDVLRISTPIRYSPDAENNLFTTSGYGLVEYTSPAKRFGAELGLRVDYYFLMGKGFSVDTKPVLNPRLNVDFNVLKDWGILKSLDISAGTGLFSSLNNIVYYAEENLEFGEGKPTRSWTSIAGTKLELSGGLVFNIEFYYKYIYDRLYIPVSITLGDPDIRPRMDGTGRAWGMDILLQKLQSRYWDGWLSYSFSWVKFYDPQSITQGFGIFGGTQENAWYFPSYHRFHNLNLVLNFRPVPNINIYTRFGIASGVQLPLRIGDRPMSYPVYVNDPGNPAHGQFIEKYVWPSVNDENNRTTPSLPLDIKISIFGKNEKGRASYELYVAVENVLALLYTARGNTTFNQYTGKIDTGSNDAFYDIPAPIPSFGFKISY